MKKEGEEAENIFIGIPLMHVSFIASLCCSPCKMGAAVHHTIII
jgi:hypothetical protein